jgi:hypothetical protein
MTQDNMSADDLRDVLEKVKLLIELENLAGWTLATTPRLSTSIARDAIDACGRERKEE